MKLKALVLLISPVLASRGFSFKDKTICNGFPYGSSTEIEGFKADLSRLEHTAPPQTYPGGQCTRIACRGNSGVYVCSDLHPPQTQTVPWQQISRAFTDSISKCKIFSNCGTAGQLSSSQKFDKGGWNVIFAAAYCDFGPTEQYPDKLPYPGPNADGSNCPALSPLPLP